MRTPLRQHVVYPALGALVIALSLSWATLLGRGPEAAAQGAPTVQTRTVGALGTVLTGPNGFTLYTFDRDMPGVSTCNDACATLWPPLVLAAGTPIAPPGLGGTLSVLMRSDGRRQVAYNTQPLYFYMPDTQPGDTRGDGVGGVWHVARAQLTTAAPAAAQPAPAAMPRTGTGVHADQQGTGSWALWGLALAAVVLGGVAVHARRRG